MEVQYAPEDVKLGDLLDVGCGKSGKGEVIFVGPVFVTARTKHGFTRTLIRKPGPARNGTRKKSLERD